MIENLEECFSQMPNDKLLSGEQKGSNYFVYVEEVDEWVAM